jgi:prepilin-type processing-associated H-X9-DG protein
MPTAWGLGRGNLKVLEGGADWFRFSSRHMSVVQFCFADGSVRGVRYGTTTTMLSPDWYILAQLSGVCDGMCNNTDSLLE